MIAIRGLHVSGDVAYAELDIACPGLPRFRCEVTLVRESYSTCTVGEPDVVNYGVSPGWADRRLLAAFERLQAQLDGYFDAELPDLPIEGCALTSAICTAVTDAVLAREWTRENPTGDGFDPCPLLVAPGSYLEGRWVRVSGEIREGRGFHPAATFSWSGFAEGRLAP